MIYTISLRDTAGKAWHLNTNQICAIADEGDRAIVHLSGGTNLEVQFPGKNSADELFRLINEKALTLDAELHYKRVQMTRAIHEQAQAEAARTQTLLVPKGVIVKGGN